MPSPSGCEGQQHFLGINPTTPAPTVETEVAYLFAMSPEEAEQY